MKTTLIRGVVAALLICAGTAQAAEDITLRIGFLRGPTDLALAKEKGTLEKALAAHHVKVEWAGPFSAAAPAYEALNAGAIDLTTGSSTAFVTAIAAGLPLQFFAYQAMPANGEGIVVRNESHIASLNDLRGKKVAVNKGGTGEYLLSRALSSAGIPEDAVQKSISARQIPERPLSAVMLMPGPSGILSCHWLNKATMRVCLPAVSRSAQKMRQVTLSVMPSRMPIRRC
ncbi:ABC transporter substrate-binding protein [Pantoea rodasii]|uniref:ABC transporter substrate-binding protein n=1 Tax=Pantoea rodasii TaxID=1076549 RepID=UPI001FCCC30B|nr:ABC transporter substrate-binding protein [Pantoea rodasii]